MTVRIHIIGAILMAALFSTGRVQAQEALLKAAQHHYESLSYIKAIDAFESALSKKGLSEAQKLDARIKLAESYTKIKDTQNAERIYREIFQGSTTDLSDDKVAASLKYAQVLASNGKYKEAQEMYDKYTRKVEDDPRGKGFSKLYNDVSVLSKNANCYKVDYLSINTNSSDFSPSYFKNGLVFVSNRRSTTGVRRVFGWNDTPFLDLYFLDNISAIGGQAAGLGTGSDDKRTPRKKSAGSLLGSDEYTAPTANDSRTIGTYGGTNVGLGLGYGDKPATESDRMSGSINSKYHEGPSAFFKDGSKVIFTRNNFLNGKARKSSDGINKLKLYIGEADKDGWKNIKELPFNSDDYSSGHPALSPDEKLLFFASDMPGGFGGTDLYVSRYDGSSWTAPVNLGKNINTKGNEMFPFVDENGNLYFSSDGHAGLGELDIFFSQLDGTTAKGRVINLGSPINSSKDDFGILTDGFRKSGYFSSNRKRGGDDDDIYKFDRECELKEGCDLIIAVYDAETKMPLDNAKIVYQAKDGSLIEKMTDADGSVKLEGLEEDQEFTFRATREGYNANTVSFSTKDCDNEPSRLEIPMAKPKPVVDSTTLAQNPTVQSGYTDKDPNSALPGNRCFLKGKVTMQGTNQPIAGVLVTLRNECNNNTQTATTDATGTYRFEVVEGCDYTVEGSKDNLGSKGKRIRRLSCKNGDVTADITMFSTGDIVQVDNIYFEYGRYNLRPDARAGLDKLVALMRQYPNMKVELRSHTDSRSDADFNQTLSENRAKSSANYLFKRGISRSRVEFKGYGETMLVNGCSDGVTCTEEQHALNRRTEIKILQMN